MQPHQQRVLDEKEELDKKIQALSLFINDTTTFITLDESEQERLDAQIKIMRDYSEILGERIREF